MVAPVRIRAARWLASEHAPPLSRRRAAGAMLVSRRSLRERPVDFEEQALLTRLRELAAERRRWGYRRLWILPRREGWKINQKRVHRLCKLAGLRVGKRPKKRPARAQRRPPPKATAANACWAMDFVSDALRDGRKFRTLNVEDECTREGLEIEVDTSIGGARVVRVLERIAAVRGCPRALRMDNGPEFTSKALDQWAHEKGVTLHFTDPGKPMRNGRLRDECLNENWFAGLEEARRITAYWLHDYNTRRLRSALGNPTPEEYANMRAATPAIVINPEA